MANGEGKMRQADLRKERFLDYPYRASSGGTPHTVAASEHLEGAPLVVTPDDHLRDLIIQVLLTNPGERVNLPEFGVGIHRLVFAPNSEALRTTTQFLITNNLQRWLGDRIDVEQVTVTSAPGEEETVSIEIVYRAKATRERQRIQVEV